MKSTTGSRMVMLTVVEEAPPEVFAHTVNIVVVMLTSGVPEMTPLSKVRPDGRAGVMDQIPTLPPLTVGESVVIVSLRINVRLYGLYDTLTAGSSTVMFTHATALPPVVLA